MDNNIDRIQDDLDQLEPSERVRAITGLINYVLPKQQSASPMEIAQAEYTQLEILLQSAPDDAINNIVARIENLKLIGNGTGRESEEDSEDNE